MGKNVFYCPVYEGQIEEYDCVEISTAIHIGRFIDDGIPFIMSIETALKRKHRCFACPRCPQHFKPRGLQRSQTLCHLGFPKDIIELEESLKQFDNQAIWPCTNYRHGKIRCFQLPCGIQLWQEWEAQFQLMHDIQAHFFTSNAMYLSANRIIRHNKSGDQVKSIFTADLRRRKGDENSPLNSAFTSPNLSVFHDEFVLKGDFIAQITAFPAKVNCFDDVETYLREREINLAAESFVSGMAMPEADIDNPGADALLTGIVQAVHLITNEATGLPFYHLELKCLGFMFDVVAAPYMFQKKPERDNVLQGVCWLSARLLDYGYSGYQLELDVSTPMTAARFEPIRLALSNLQPGERLYCGIDAPLDDIVLIRAKGEVEGISVELRLEPQDEGEKDRNPFAIRRFYPVSKPMAIKIFEQTLVYHNPPCLGDAQDVTNEYLEKGEYI